MKIRLIFLNGQELSVTTAELISLLASKQVLPYYAASLFYMWAVELYYFLPTIPLSLYSAVNFLIVSSTLFIFLVITYLLIRVQALQNKICKAYLSVLFLLANIVVNIVMFGITILMLNVKISYWTIICVFLNNIILTEITLFIFSIYTLPLVNSSLNQEQHLDTRDGDIISVSGNPIRSSTIMYIKSDDAYLHIKTTNSTLHVRGNVSDYAKILKRYGVLAHRSFWINPKHIISIEKQGTTLKYVTMNDNVKIPISKARSALVQQNL